MVASIIKFKFVIMVMSIITQGPKGCKHNSIHYYGWRVRSRIKGYDMGAGWSEV